MLRFQEAVIVAAAAAKFNCSVRCVLTRREDMSAHGPRHEMMAEYDVDVCPDTGRLGRVRLECWANGGATADNSHPWAANVLWRCDGGYTLNDFQGKIHVCR